MKKRNLIIALAASILCIGEIHALTPVTQSPSMQSDTNKGIAFVEGKTFEQALAMAKEANKMLFVDCYTSWCGPCKMMATQVFTQKAAGDYFNKEFVSIKIDMEKGEGPAVKNRFGVRAYPTFLFIDQTGKEINRIVGGDRDVNKFIAKVKEGLGTNSLSALAERYERGERDTTFLFSYLKALDTAYDNKKSAEVAGVLLAGNEKDMLTNNNLYEAFVNYNSSPLTAAFQYMLVHKSEFEAKYGARNVNMVADRVWMQFPRSYVKKNADGTAEFDKVGMDAYKAEMKKWGVAKYDEICLNVDISWAEARGDWNQFVALCDKHIKKFHSGDMDIYNWALRLQKNCQDKTVNKVAIKWMKKRIKEIKAEEAKLPPLKEGEIRATAMVNFADAYEKLIKELE